MQAQAQAQDMQKITEALDSDGYVVLRNLIDGVWIERLRRAFDDTYGQKQGTQHVRVNATTIESAAWTELCDHATIRAAVQHVLQRPFEVLDCHGRNPLSGYGEQGLHMDGLPRAEGAPYQVASVIGMLDDFARDNGATRIVAGTHKLPGAIPKPIAQPLVRHPDEKIIAGKAGDIVVLNGHVWHSGTRNDSDRPRRAVQIIFRPTPPTPTTTA